MRYHNITKDDMLNGEGLRVVLWVAGCSHNCPECHNPVTWDIRGGIPFDQAAKDELFEELQKDYVSGVTLSGGDPLHPDNREETGRLIDEICDRFPGKTTEEAAVKAAVVRRAREAWFLVDDSKFARIYPAVIAELSGGAILTNHCPNPKYRQFTLVKEAAE